MIVFKFGGSSVATAPNIKQVKDILSQQSSPFLVVVSAFSGSTDALINIAEKALSNNFEANLEAFQQKHTATSKELIDVSGQAPVLIFIQKQCNEIKKLCQGIAALQELSDKTKAKVLQYGEILSAYIIHQYFVQENISLQLIDSRNYIQTEGSYLQSRLIQNTSEQNIARLDKNLNYIAPGFIASNKEGDTMLLGRGGSDYTAAIYAAALQASRVEIWSDVDGMLSANPTVVKGAATIQNLSYKEAFELSHFGAKVLYGPTIRPLMRKEIPVYLKNTFNPLASGTYIGPLAHTETSIAKGVSSIPDISILSISGVGMAGIKGTASRIFSSLEKAAVNVILITQCCSEQSICIGIDKKDAQHALVALQDNFKYELEALLIDEIDLKSDYSVIALVGDGMKMKVGLSGKVFGALGENAINIIAIAQGASERNISLVIERKDEAKALNVLHERFFEDAIQKYHLFIAGIGNVGQKFIDIVKQQKDYLIKEYKVDIKIIGLANSTKYHFNANGIQTISRKSLMEKGETYTQFSEFVDNALALNLQNSIFIDNTASEVVSGFYASFLEQSIDVIACNKIACSAAYTDYQSLLQKAKDNNCHFYYETTVGAALPVIKTIQDLVLSGDTITSINAVLSGSLNFIFNNYDARSNFASVVQRAAVEGYTEPNPLIDLSGVDVMRKILILAREGGYALEMQNIEARHFLPENCLKSTDKASLLASIEQEENHFKQLYEAAKANNCKLKFVATFEAGKAYVGLQQIPPESPFYHLEGKDNIVSVHSLRYPDEPLVIKGAGAGAELTASGVFSDLMMLINT